MAVRLRDERPFSDRSRGWKTEGGEETQVFKLQLAGPGLGGWQEAQGIMVPNSATTGLSKEMLMPEGRYYAESVTTEYRQHGND